MVKPASRPSYCTWSLVAVIMYYPPWEGAMRVVPYNLDLYGLFNINLETKFNPDTSIKLLNSFQSNDGFCNTGVT